jgi:transcriptional regulator with XRE-family HTH domain
VSFSIRPDQKRLKLYDVRVERGLSMFQVAAATGLSAGQLSNYERGLREPLLSTAMRLAKFFNTPVEELFSYSKT